MALQPWLLTVDVYTFTNGPEQANASPQSCYVEFSRGAQAGYPASLSDEWVALGSSKLGKATDQENQGAECGVTPVVFLARRNQSSSAPRPFGGLEHVVAAPNQEDIRGLAIGVDALALKTATGV